MHLSLVLCAILWNLRTFILNKRPGGRGYREPFSTRMMQLAALEAKIISDSMGRAQKDAFREVGLANLEREIQRSQTQGHRLKFDVDVLQMCCTGLENLLTGLPIVGRLIRIVGRRSLTFWAESRD